jgi:hypothetical protein
VERVPNLLVFFVVVVSALAGASQSRLLVTLEEMLTIDIINFGKHNILPSWTNYLTAE